MGIDVESFKPEPPSVVYEVTTEAYVCTVSWPAFICIVLSCLFAVYSLVNECRTRDEYEERISQFHQAGVREGRAAGIQLAPETWYQQLREQHIQPLIDALESARDEVQASPGILTQTELYEQYITNLDLYCRDSAVVCIGMCIYVLATTACGPLLILNRDFSIVMQLRHNIMQGCIGKLSIYNNTLNQWTMLTRADMNQHIAQLSRLYRSCGIGSHSSERPILEGHGWCTILMAQWMQQHDWSLVKARVATPPQVPPLPAPTSTIMTRSRKRVHFEERR